MTLFPVPPRAIAALEVISERTYVYAKAMGKTLGDQTPAIASAALQISDVALVVLVAVYLRHDGHRLWPRLQSLCRLLRDWLRRH